MQEQSIRYAVVGCLHGKLEAVYRKIAIRDEQDGVQTLLLLVCGDFQAIRNTEDLKTVAVPRKYLSQLGDFWEYYCGEKQAPMLTLVIGGNHEASHYMRELYFGGYLAPNIYFVGSSGVANVVGPSDQNLLRVFGMSGIFKPYSFAQPCKKVPLDEDSKRSVYHTNHLDIVRGALLEQKVDIGLSHDWPRGAHRYGDLGELVRVKPFFEKDIKTGRFGNPAASFMLDRIRP